MMRSICILGLLLLANPISARAQDRVIQLSTPYEVSKALQEAGYKAEIAKSDKGDPFIRSAANGDDFTISFFGCELATACSSLQFYSWYKKKPWYTPELANRWNSSKRFLTIEIDDVGDLGMHMDVATKGKLTSANFADLIDWWSVMSGDLGKFLDEEEAKIAKPTSKPAH